MNPDLTKKLRVAIDQYSSTRYAGDYVGDNLIPQIRQAFIDDGWVKQFKLSEDIAWKHCVVCGNSVSDGHVHKEDVMTGQDWYDKLLLKVDVHRYHELDPEYTAQQEVLEAAKKAAGIE